MISSKNYEVAGFVSRTHHIFTEVSMMASARKMASLPPDVQKVIREAAVEACRRNVEANLKAQASAWTDLAKLIKANPNPDIAASAPRWARSSKASSAGGTERQGAGRGRAGRRQG